MFSAFEEWMYASDTEKASAELENIKTSIANLRNVIDELPSLLADARGVIPNMAETLHHDYTTTRKRGVYLHHLDIQNNLSLITEGLKKDLANLKNCDATDVKEHLEDYKTRLTQMDDAVKNENECFTRLTEVAEDVDKSYSKSLENLDYVKKQYEVVSARFGLEGLEEGIKDAETKITDITARKPELDALVKESETPASKAVNELQSFDKELTEINTSIEEMKSRIDSASGDEERAKKQLVKLQVIMNQLQVSIRKYKIPSISSQYEEDMNKASEYMVGLENLMNETPLNVQLLNSTLKEAIDFIYKLYNNVNNVVGAVMMVENTIVFGNRYRSTYSDIDSELTRSELCFRNGEYTQALQIAIATIEKIHPGNYEKMVKENAKAANE